MIDYSNSGTTSHKFSLLLLVPMFLFAQDLHAQQLSTVFSDEAMNWLDRESPEKGEAENEPLETDRDSFTFAATTVGKGRSLTEMSYSFIDNQRVPETNSYPEMITRVGVTDRLELRIGWNYEVGGGGDVSNGDAGGDLADPGKKRESQIAYGFKYALSKQKSWLPESAIIIQGTTPTSGPSNASRVLVGYVFGWTILEDWKLDAAIRYGTEEEDKDHFNQWAPSVVLKKTIRERWNIHGEYFGIFTNGRTINSNAQYFSPGIAYVISKDCEIGIRVGWGLNQDSANFFSNVGLGVRF